MAIEPTVNGRQTPVKLPSNKCGRPLLRGNETIPTTKIKTKANLLLVLSNSRAACNKQHETKQNENENKHATGEFAFATMVQVPAFLLYFDFCVDKC